MKDKTKLKATVKTEAKNNNKAVRKVLSPVRVRHGEKAPAHLKHSKAKTALSWLIVIGAALGLAFLMRAYVAEPFEVPSGSMLQTIKIGDRLIGEKITYLHEDPKHGDIATFTDPENPNIILIKRVIGTPGDVIDLKDGAVYINGTKQDEPYTSHLPTYPLAPASFLKEPISYPYTLGDNEYWMMGDNRTNSADSRYFGPIKRDTISSKAWFIFWPFSEMKVL